MYGSSALARLRLRPGGARDDGARSKHQGPGSAPPRPPRARGHATALLEYAKYTAPTHLLASSSGQDEPETRDGASSAGTLRSIKSGKRATFGGESAFSGSLLRNYRSGARGVQEGGGLQSRLRSTFAAIHRAGSSLGGICLQYAGQGESYQPATPDSYLPWVREAPCCAGRG